MFMVTATLFAMALKTFDEPLPTYALKDGETWKFAVKAKVEIQPYSYGGVLTVTFKSKGKLYDMVLNYKSEMEMNGEKGPGPEELAIFETDEHLKPTGSGQGAINFGDQLLSILVLPSDGQVRLPLFADSSLFATKATVEKDMIRVTSAISNRYGESTVDRWLDAKTKKLLKAKCSTKNALGITNYELLPIK
jgi:hypothetical protein